MAEQWQGFPIFRGRALRVGRHWGGTQRSTGAEVLPLTHSIRTKSTLSLLGLSLDSETAPPFGDLSVESVGPVLRFECTTWLKKVFFYFFFIYSTLMTISKY